MGSQVIDAVPLLKRDTRKRFSINSARESVATSVMSNNLALQVQCSSELNGPQNFVECSQTSERSGRDSKH
jgi:hypothetical protein